MSFAVQTMPGKSARRAPSPSKVLRGLFWTLLFRGRAAQQAGAQKTRRQMGLGLTMLIYALVGLVPALFAAKFQVKGNAIFKVFQATSVWREFRMCCCRIF